MYRRSSLGEWKSKFLLTRLLVRTRRRMFAQTLFVCLSAFLTLAACLSAGDKYRRLLWRCTAWKTDLGDWRSKRGNAMRVCSASVIKQPINVTDYTGHLCPMNHFCVVLLSYLASLLARGTIGRVTGNNRPRVKTRENERG